MPTEYTADPPPDPEAPVEEDVEVKPSTYDIEVANLVPTFAKNEEWARWLDEQSAFIRQSFQEEWDASEPWRMRWASNWKVLVGFLPPAERPFRDSAQAHLPIMMENITQMCLLMSSEIFGDWKQFFQAEALGPQGRDVARLLTQHGNWQFRNQIVGFPREMDRALLAFNCIGDVTVHSYRDPDRKTNRHEVLTPDEFLVPYAITTSAPDYSDCPWRIKILRRYPYEIRRRRKDWENIDKVLEGDPPPWDDDPVPRLGIAANQAMKKAPTDTKGTRPYRLLQWEGWLEMPEGSTDGRDRERFMQVILDSVSGHVLLMRLHEQENWEDKERFESQAMERSGFMDAMEAANAAAVQRSEMASALAQQVASLQITQEMADAQLGMMPMPEVPERPKWMGEQAEDEDMLPLPEPIRMEPIHLFHHGVAFEPLVGSLGFGPGWAQADMNRAVNVLLKHTIDAASIGNGGGFIVAPGVQFKGKFQWSPNGLTYLDSMPGMKIEDALMPINGPGANPQLMEAANLLMDRAQSMTHANEVLAGEPGKSGEAAKEHQARVELATKPISVLGYKFLNGVLEPILLANANLNSIHMDDEEIFSIYNEDQEYYGPQTVSRAMYDRSYRVSFSANMRFLTETQAVAEADDLFGLFAPDKVPELKADIPLVYAIVKKALEARKERDLVKKLGPQPPDPLTTFGLPAPPPPGMVDPNAPPVDRNAPPPNGVPAQPPMAAA